MKQTKILIGLLLLIAILSLVYQPNKSNIVITTNKIEPFSSKKDIKLEDFIDESKLKQANPTEYAKIEDMLKRFRQELKEDLPALDKYALRTEIPNQSCVVSKSIDKDAYIKKNELEEMKKCPVPNDYDPTQYILKSSVPAKSCPPQQEIDTTKWVLKSSLPPPQKCSACICPKVSVSAGLCKKCPPPPKCPPPQPCPQVKCPDVKPCPPPAPCPACPEPQPCPPKICPPCPAQKDCPPQICPPCPVNKKIIERVYLDVNGNEIKRVQSEEGDDKKPLILACPTPTTTTQTTTPTTTTQTTTPTTTTITTPPTPTTAPMITKPENNKINKESSISNWFSELISNRSQSGLATPSPYSTSESPTKSGSDTVDTGLISKNNKSNDNNGEFKLNNAKWESKRPTYTPPKDALTRDEQKCSNMSFNQAFKNYRPY